MDIIPLVNWGLMTGLGMKIFLDIIGIYPIGILKE